MDLNRNNTGHFGKLVKEVIRLSSKSIVFKTVSVPTKTIEKPGGVFKLLHLEERFRFGQVW